MEKYVYRFLDENSNIIYIGKTNDLQSRMNTHFTTGHLSNAQYRKVKQIEYILFTSEADQHIAEIYLINKYKPCFNTSDKKKDNLTLYIEINQDWKMFDNCVSEFKYRKRVIGNLSKLTTNQLRDTINF